MLKRAQAIREAGREPSPEAGQADHQLSLLNGERQQAKEAPAQGGHLEPGEVARTESCPVRENCFYLPVDQIRAQVFLAHGLIFPALYDRAASRDFDDDQAKAPSRLAFSATPPPIGKNQLLLRVLLRPDEVGEAECLRDLLRFPKPLPISRMVGIEVPPEAGDLDSYAAGWLSPDVPVPRHLFSLARVQPEGITEDGSKEPAAGSEETDPAIEEAIGRFDRYMGLMALLRNAGRYFSATMGRYADYPEAFFPLCSAVMHDPSVAPAGAPAPDPFLMKLLDQEARVSAPAEALLRLVTAPEPYLEKERARSLAMEIYKAAGENEELAQAFKALFDGDYRSAIRVLQSPALPREAALLAALFHFCGRHTSDHRTVKQRLHEDWVAYDQAVRALGLLGAYFGYAALDARETRLYSVHPLLAPLVEEGPEIKFHIRTTFERRLIEALYQWAFYRRAPDPSSKSLYDGIQAAAPLPPPAPPSAILLRGDPYQVGDLIVRRYEVTPIGRIVQRLKERRGDFLDERSELGRCLLLQCLPYADEVELGLKGGRTMLRYRMSKPRLIDLLSEGRITVSARVVEAALDADEGSPHP